TSASRAASSSRSRRAAAPASPPTSRSSRSASASACPRTTSTCASSSSGSSRRCRDVRRTARSRRGAGRTRPLPRSRRERVRPAAAARRAHPGRRFDGYCPRGPLSLPPGGAHWYVVPRVGYPDPPTFAQGFAAAAGFVDALPHERIVLGGFSQGAVMALSVGLGEGRPRPAAVIAFSGFLPEVEGWTLGGEPWPAIAVGHGTYDDVIPIEFAHRTRERLLAAGADVLYRESA